MSGKIILTLVGALTVGGAGGYWFANQNMSHGDNSATEAPERKVLFYRNPMNPAITSPVFQQDEMGMDYIPVYADGGSKPKAERKVLFYRNPMNPAITSPVFQQDEMGMDYIAVYADGGANDGEPAGTVKIDPVVVQNIGVRTEIVQLKSISRRLNALGRIDFNEERLARLHPKTTGWVKKLHVDDTGALVKKGAILLSIYSPDLVAAQREYLVALKNWEGLSTKSSDRIRQTTNTVLNSALDRLELLDVPAHQLAELKKTRKMSKYLHIHSPFSGVAMNIGAREGQYVTPKDEIYMIADLKKIWVYVDIYEDAIAWVKKGDEVEMKVRAAPGKTFTGKVRFIYPYLDGKTRTMRVRLVFDNKHNTLKPGMFANVTIRTDKQKEAVVVSSSAIVRTGSREQVFVVRAPGKFEPREVVLGLSSDGYVQILSGLKAGEEVVTSATFLIDSESKLKEATAKMLEAMEQESQTGSQPSSQSGNGDASMEMGGMDMSMDSADMSGMKMDDMSGMDMSDDAMGNSNSHEKMSNMKMSK